MTLISGAWACGTPCHRTWLSRGVGLGSQSHRRVCVCVWGGGVRAPCAHQFPWEPCISPPDLPLTQIPDPGAEMMSCGLLTSSKEPGESGLRGMVH